jgi:tetratricopeptide (TPR) repeat protein
MSSRAWNKRPGWSLPPVVPAHVVLAALAALAACGSPRTRPEPAALPPPPPARATPASPPPPAALTPAPPAGGAPAAGAASTVPVHPDVPPAARNDFDRAVNFMRAGNKLEAELGFKQVALQYPQFAAPLVNLAILERKDGRPDVAEQILKSAVAREPGSAVAWTELGATQRLRGEFKDAVSSYESAISADPRYAPAWRNLGVLADLYLGDPRRALTAFEQYRQLTGEEKPVSGWIAELRQRLGLGPAKRPAAEAPGEGKPGSSPPSEASPGAPPAANPGATPRGAPEPAPPGPGDPQTDPAPASATGAPSESNARRAGG